MNPFQSAPHGKKMMTVWAIYLGVICNVFVATTFPGMLPAAAEEMPDGEIWPVAMAIPSILGICAMPLYGYFGAKNPASKRVFVTVSMLVAALVMLGRGVAPNMMVIVIVSAFWGFLSASVFVLGFTMVRDMFDREKSGFYLGLVATMMSIAMLAGPFLGGAIMDHWGWRPLNLIICVVLVIAAAMAWFGVKVSPEEAKPLATSSGSFDFAGAGAMTVFLGSLIIMLSMTTYFPLGGVVSNLLAVVAIVSLVGLILIIRKKGDRAIVPVSVFADRNTMIFAICNFLTIFSVMTLTSFLPGYVRAGLPTDSIVETIGLSLASLLPTACGAVAGLFLGPIFGKWVAKAGTAKGLLTFGSIVRFVVFCAMLLVVKEVFGGVSYIAILVIMLVSGVYSAQNSVTYSAGPQIQIRPALRVQSNSVIQVGQNLGGGISIPVYSMVMAAFTAPLVAAGVENASGQGLVDAFPTMFIISIGVIAVLFVLGFFLKPLPKEEEAMAA